MKKITRQAYGKINLGLDVLGKREDGYHIVRMIMQTVELHDTLTFKENAVGIIDFCFDKNIVFIDVVHFFFSYEYKIVVKRV